MCDLYLKAGLLFFSTERGILPVHNLPALNGRTFEVIGKIMAAIILLGGSPPQCFVPEITDFLVYGEVRRASMDTRISLTAKCVI